MFSENQIWILQGRRRRVSKLLPSAQVPEERVKPRLNLMGSKNKARKNTSLESGPDPTSVGRRRGLSAELPSGLAEFSRSNSHLE